MQRPPRIFALGASRVFGERLCEALGERLSEHEEREFAGGEHKARPLQSVRDRDVYVVHSLCGDAEQSANDKLCRLLFFIGAAKDAGAQRVTALVPYLAYARKDRKTKSRDPVTTRYVAALFESMGTDRVVTIDVHNLAAYQNAFRCATEHLEARLLFAEHLLSQLSGRRFAVVSPDTGGAKRANALRETLQKRLGQDVPLAFMEKRRSRDVVSGDLLVGDVQGSTAIIYDDMISSGTTLVRAARACRQAGARRVVAAATHGAFTAGASQLASEGVFDNLLITDTVNGLAPPQLAARLEIVSAVPLFAEAVKRLQVGESLTEMLEFE